MSAGERRVGVPDALVLAVRGGAEPHRKFAEVALTKFSTGANFVFLERGRSLPLIQR